MATDVYDKWFCPECQVSSLVTQMRKGMCYHFDGALAAAIRDLKDTASIGAAIGPAEIVKAPEPQPIHERYAERLVTLARLCFGRPEKPLPNAFTVQGAVILREMVEEIRLEVQQADAVRMWDEHSAKVAAERAAMEGGSPTYTQGSNKQDLDEEQLRDLVDQIAANTPKPNVFVACSGCAGLTTGHGSTCAKASQAVGPNPLRYTYNLLCGTHGIYEASIGGNNRLTGCPKCEHQDSPGAWSCPRHGRYPAFSKNAFTDEDVPHGCPSCGSRLVKS
jgi:hypothetical protein